MSTDAGGKSALNEGLGLAPERAGQPRMMIIIDGAQDDETGHWYSPAAVREILAAERERWAAAVRRMHAADDRYGCGFYNDDEWRAAYDELRAMCGPN